MEHRIRSAVHYTPLQRQVVAQGRIMELILGELPPGREKALALTKLEEVVMWANKSVAVANVVAEDDHGKGETKV